MERYLNAENRPLGEHCIACPEREGLFCIPDHGSIRGGPIVEWYGAMSRGCQIATKKLPVEEFFGCGICDVKREEAQCEHI
jgi:hypothetical protein